MPKLRWTRTKLPSRPENDYTGRDRGNPDVFARVFLASGHPGPGPRWSWGVNVHPVQIGSGFELTDKAAAASAQACYDRWVASQSG